MFPAPPYAAMPEDERRNRYALQQAQGESDPSRWSDTRIFPTLAGASSDIKSPVLDDGDIVVLGGGGLISVNFARHMERLASLRKRMSAMDQRP